MHFAAVEKPKGSFKREYATERDKEVAQHQEERQHQLYKTMEQGEEVAAHNAEMLKDALKGDEGVDWVHLKPG